MNNMKTELRYLIIYLILNTIGILVASTIWWTDNLNLSFLKEETLLLLFSTGICWIGIIHLSIFIIRKFIVKIDNSKFIGPIDLVFNEYYQNEIGIGNAIKFKKSMTLVSFSLFIVTIGCFFLGTNIYKNYQLNNYGVNETVRVKEIRFDMKENPYIYFEYNNGNSSTLLYNKGFKVGDRTIIIFSINNPRIIEYQDK